MFSIPPGFEKVTNPAVNRRFVDLVAMFQKYEDLLRYPNSEGYADQQRYLVKMQNELIMKGYL
jgi:hypothetical protein